MELLGCCYDPEIHCQKVVSPAFKMFLFTSREKQGVPGQMGSLRS